MKRYLLILLTLTIVTGVGYSQVPIKRKKTEKTEQTQSASSRQNQQQTSNNKKKVQSSVKVSEPDGYINGHGFVDLGLPSGTKWAICNIGASSPEKYGEYFAWGETIAKTKYSDDTWWHIPPIEIVDGVRTYTCSDYEALVNKMYVIKTEI